MAAETLQFVYFEILTLGDELSLHKTSLLLLNDISALNYNNT